MSSLNRRGFLSIPCDSHRGLYFIKKIPKSCGKNFKNKSSYHVKCESENQDSQTTSNESKNEESSSESLSQIALEKIKKIKATKDSKNQAQRVVLGSSLPLARPVLYPSWYSSTNGVVLACAFLAAARLGRHEAEEAELIFDTAKIEEQLMLSENKEISKRRKQFAKQQAKLKEMEAMKRIEDVKKKSREAEIERKEKEKQYRLEQQREIQRTKELKAIEKKRYDEQEKSLSSELAKRTELELKIKKEMDEAKKQREAEMLRLEEEKRKLEVQRQREEEMRRQKELEEITMKIEKKKQELENKKQKFAVRLEGIMVIGPSERNKMTSGPIPEQAKFNISVKTRTVLSPNEREFSQDFSNIEAIKENPNIIVGIVIKYSIDDYVSSMRLQAMTGSGPLSILPQAEFDCWMKFCILRSIFIASQDLLTLLDDYENDVHKINKQKSFQVRTEWGILPVNHEKRTDCMIREASKHVLAKQERSKAKKILDEIIEIEVDKYYTDLKQNNKDKFFSYAPYICMLSMIYDYATNEYNADIIQGFEELIKEMMSIVCDSAPMDSLYIEYPSIEIALGHGHPVVAMFSKYCERNKSAATKYAEIQKKRLMEKKMEERVMQEEWPDKEQMSQEIAKEKEEGTPVPERVWALKNVARTLGLNATSESSLVQATELIKKAVSIQRDYLGNELHPGMLGPLFDCAMITARSKSTIKEAVIAWEEILKILEFTAEKYRKQGDFYSAVLCAESGLLAAEQFLSPRNPSVKKLTKSVENWIGLLKETETVKISSFRKSGAGMAHIASCFTPELGTYKKFGKKDRLEQWSSNENLESL